MFTADISRTGFYGFPVAANNDVLKLGNHGRGFVVRKTCTDGRVCFVPDSSIPMPKSEQDRLLKCIYTTFPDLENAELLKSKICWYCESWDSYFYIDHVPGRQGLAVACGSTGYVIISPLFL